MNRETQKTTIQKFATQQRAAGHKLSDSDTEIFLALMCSEDLNTEQQARVEEMKKQLK